MATSKLCVHMNKIRGTEVSHLKGGGGEKESLQKQVTGERIKSINCLVCSQG